MRTDTKIKKHEIFEYLDNVIGPVRCGFVVDMIQLKFKVTKSDTMLLIEEWEEKQPKLLLENDGS